jgi:hypothetical protein
MKDTNRREPGKRLHILVMNDGGSTRRLSVSVSFLWIMATLSILTLFSLGVLAWLVSSLLVEHKSLRNELAFLNAYSETKEYNKSLSSAPEDARLILERLDRAALSDEEEGDELALPQAVDSSPAQGAGESKPGNLLGEGKNPQGGSGSSQSAAAGAAKTEGENLSGSSGKDAGSGNGPAPAAGESGSSEAGSGGDPASEGSGEGTASAGSQGGETSAEAAAWQTFHNRLSMPPDPNILDVDEFRFSPRGSYTFYLQQIKSPGTRLKGRAITVFALEDKNGEVTLVSDPPIDLSKPFQGFEKGGKYNIVSSKVYKGNIRIPEGGKALSAEVLAWDEETRELVFLKKISLRGL